VAQNETVMDTLESLNVSQQLSNSMIVVGNKIDLVR
jgi:50S ribosomal subunit-associated GTPase HflX